MNIDPEPYLRVPVQAPAFVLALSRRLLLAYAANDIVEVAPAAENLRRTARVLQGQWIERLGRPEPGGMRLLDRRLDSAVRGVRARLAPWLDSPDAPQRARAEELDQLLFASGLRFTQLRLEEEWEESNKRLIALEERGLTATLVELVGQSFVDAWQDAHSACGDALGLTEHKVAVEQLPLTGALRDTQEAIRWYALAVLGTMRQDDETSQARALRALQPIVDAREAQRQASSASAAPVEEPSGEEIEIPPAGATP